MADGGATAFLEAQSAAHPELASWYAELADLYNRKLWHQLTVKLEQFLAHVLSLPAPKVSGLLTASAPSQSFLTCPHPFSLIHLKFASYPLLNLSFNLIHPVVAVSPSKITSRF